jgi:hypothetical protein
MLTWASLRTRTESVTKEVKQVIRAKGAHRRRKPPRFALGPSAGWRVLSVLAMGLFGAILLAPGAAVAKTAPVKASLNVVVIGDLYSYGAATSSNADLRHAAPPTLQALNQIQAANKGVRLNVLFIPVTEASPSLLSQPSGSGTSKRQALIKAVSGAGVVIVGVGAGNASLAASMRSVLFGSSAPQSTFNELMSSIDSGTYLQNQTALLNEVAANAAPGASIISIGYPGMQPEQLGSGLHFFSPYTLTTVSPQQANASAQLVSALNTADNEATSIVAAQNHGLHFLFASLSAVAQSTGSSSKAHSRSKAGVVSSQSQPSDLNLLGSAMVPYVDQAVNDQLAAKGVMGAQSIPVLTPKAPWNLQVLVPLSPQSQPSASSSSNSGVNAPPAPVTPPNQPNPQPTFPVPPPAGPSSGGNGSGGSGSHHHGGGGSSGSGSGGSVGIGGGGVGISTGSGGSGTGNTGTGNTGTGNTGTGSSGGNGQSNSPPGSGQTKPGSQPTGGQPNQGSGSNHPATQPAGSQSTPASQPGSSQPSTSSGRPGPCGNSAEPNATVTCSPANAAPTPSAGSPPVKPVTLPMQCAPTAQSASSPSGGGATCASSPSTQANTPSSSPGTTPASSPTPACSASEFFGISQPGCGSQPGQSQGGTGPLTPMVPAPPAPLPKPIAPQQAPGAPTGNTGTSTSASSPTASSSPATSQDSTTPPTTTAATPPSSQPSGSSAPATTPSSQPGDSSAPVTAAEGGAPTTAALGNTAAGGSTTTGLSTTATGGNTAATGGSTAVTGGSTANGSSATATGGAAATRGNTAAGGSNTATTGGSTASAGGSTASGAGGGSGGGATSGS